MTDLMFVIANEPYRPFGSIRNALPDAVGAIVDTVLAKAPARRRSDGTTTARAMGDAAARWV